MTSEKLDNGLTFSFIQNVDFEYNALALHWDYIAGVAQERAGLRSAHMRCLLQNLKNQITAYPTLEWEALEVSAKGNLISLLPATEDLPEIMDWLANGITSFELNATTWSIVQVEMQAELLKRGAFSTIEPMDQLMRHRLFSVQHPYGEIPNESSVSNIQLEDIRAFHHRYFLPNNCKIALCMNADNPEARHNAETAFGKWKARSVPVSSVMRPRVGRNTELAWITSDDKESLTFQMGHVMRLKPGNENEWILKALANIIRNRLQSIMKAGARIEVDFESDASMGRFIIRGSQLSENFMQICIQEALNLLQQMTEELPSDDELAQAIEQLINEHGIHLMNPAYVAEMAADGNSSDHLKSENEVRNSFKQVSVIDVRRVANNLLRPNSLQIVGSGPQELGKALGNAIDSDNAMDEYTLAGKLIEPYSPAPGLTSNYIFDSYYAACGGKSAFEDLKSSRTVVRMDAEGGTVFTVTTEKQYGIGFSSSFEANGQVMMENVVTMEEGFKRQMDINQIMSAREYQRLKPDLYAARFLHLDELRGVTEVLGTVESNGTIQHVVRIHFEGNVVETLFFDQTSSLLIKSIVERSGATGQNKTINDFDEYKTYDGLTFPSRITQTTNGRLVELITEEMRLNVRINSDTFNRN